MQASEGETNADPTNNEESTEEDSKGGALMQKSPSGGMPKWQLPPPELIAYQLKMMMSAQPPSTKAAPFDPNDYTSEQPPKKNAYHEKTTGEIINEVLKDGDTEEQKNERAKKLAEKDSKEEAEHVAEEEENSPTLKSGPSLAVTESKALSRDEEKAAAEAKVKKLTEEVAAIKKKLEEQ